MLIFNTIIVNEGGGKEAGGVGKKENGKKFNS